MLGNCSGFEVHLLDFMYKATLENPHVWYICLLYSLEISILLLDCCLAIVGIILLFKTSVWHSNLNSVVIFLISVQIPGHFGRMYFIIYEFVYGLNNGDCNIYLITATFFQLVYIHSIAHSILGCCVERLLALYFIEDYEKRRRSLIPILIICTMIITAIIFSYLNIASAMEIHHFAFYAIFLVIAEAVIGVSMIWWNRKLTKTLEACKKPDEYTLSKRFQLQENMKVLQLCKKLLGVVGILIILVSTSLITLVTNDRTALGIMFFEITKSSCPSVVMISAILMTPKWRAKVKSWLNIKNTSLVQPLPFMNETDQYFHNLALSWNS